MKSFLTVTSTTVGIAMVFGLYACSTQEEAMQKPAPAAVASKPAPAEAASATAKAPEKAKATKVSGDIGLLDTEKNYMIVVTKEGKLVTVDFDPKFQPTARTPHPAKVADIGLGSQATVQFNKQGAKNVANQVEFVQKKGE